MSTLKVNALINGGSAIDLPSSFKLNGNPIEQGYTSSATEPTSPNTGDLWWDSTNEVLYQYLNGEFKKITLLEADPWYTDISSISYDSTSTGTSPEGQPRAYRQSVDGTKHYVLGSEDDKVYEYTLSTAFDIGAKTYVSVFSVASQSTSPQGLDFSYDGTKMFVLQSGGTIYAYNLSTAWDSSTASYSNTSLDITTVHSANSAPHGIMFSKDGTKLYTTDYTADKVHQYSLSTAYDLSSTVTHDGDYGSSSLFQQPGDIYVNRKGTHIYIPDVNAEVIREIVMSTALDISTASLTSTNFSHATQGNDGLGLHFSEDGTKMFFMSFANDTIYQYTSGTAT